MELNIRPAEECKYDAVSLGEIMLRLDPGEGRIRTARSFRAWEGGGEYNVIRGLHKCFGLNTAVITAFADNEIGKLMKDFIEQGGVNTDLIFWKKTDGIGRICRNGINFTERGFGIRGAVGCSDRANTAISQAAPEDFDFDYIFGELGVRWLHTGGIYAALSEQSCRTVIEACKAAKKYGTIVSYDLNYRPSMWSAIGGLDKAREVNKEVAKYVDVLTTVLCSVLEEIIVSPSTVISKSDIFNTSNRLEPPSTLFKYVPSLEVNVIRPPARTEAVTP